MTEIPRTTQSPWTLRRWLLVLVTAINVLVISLGVKSLWISHDQAVARAAQAIKNLSTVLDSNLAFSGQGIDYALQGIAESLEAMQKNKHMTDADVEALLEAHSKRHPEVTAFRVSRADGVVWWGQGVDRAKPVSYAERDYFAFHRANPGQSLVVTAPLIGKVTQQWVIAFVRSYRNPDGSFAGVITASVPVAHFNTLLSSLDLGERGVAAIRYADLSIVTRYPDTGDSATVTGSRKISPELKALIDAGAQSGDYYSANSPDGIDRTYAFRRISGLPLMIIVGLSPQDYLASWQRELRYTVLTLLAFMVVSLLGTRIILGFWRRNADDLAALQASEDRLKIAVSQAQAANKAKSQFLATVSHEIKTPLNGVLGMAQMLQMPDISPSERMDYAQTIVKSGRALLTLLNDILDFSWLDAGRLELGQFPFDPAQLLLEAKTLFEEAAHGKGLEITAVGPEDVEFFEGDSFRLQQMLSNYVDNAIKFTAQGSIHIVAKKLEQDANTALLEFSVTDTGIGIGEEQLATLFTPFSQVDASTTRTQGGTGLGLAIVRNLALLMGGDAGAVSKLGAGSTFWFRVRVKRTAETPENSAATAANRYDEYLRRKA